ncbi:MAG: hypothetical protein R3D33_05585 [Hyphomicrobiaceae bacterium]
MLQIDLGELQNFGVVQWATLYGIAAVIASALGFLVAALKRRSTDQWATACFFMPPLLLVLLVLGRGSPEDKRSRELKRTIDKLRDRD